MPIAPPTPDTGVRENGQPVSRRWAWDRSRRDEMGLPVAVSYPVAHEGHTHVDERGIAVRCYHSCRTAVLSGGFWLGVTISFPAEHLLWTKLWPFRLLTKALGL